MSGEADYLVTAGGQKFPLHLLGAEVANLGGIPVQYQTARGFGQHGHSVLGWRLEARTLTFRWLDVAVNRAALWARRAALLGALKPNNGIVTYRRVLPDGQVRQIQGWLGGDLSLQEDGGPYQEVGFSLECPDPSFYDPTELTTTLAEGTPLALAFPVWFSDGLSAEDDDFWFDEEGVAAGMVDYAGSWRCYPVIAIDGPYSWLRLTNTTTGAYLTLGVALAAGQTLTIDLTPGAQTITDNLGSDRLSDRTAGSFIDWYLEAGTNVFKATGAGISGSTEIRLFYTNRYIAI